MAQDPILSAAQTDALALTQFLTEPAGTTNRNSVGADIGTLSDIAGTLAPVFGTTAEMLADTVPRPVGSLIHTASPHASYKVVDAALPAHLTTAGGAGLAHLEGAYVIAIAGQSNAAGVHVDGPNPASPLVRSWDAPAGAWGGSDRTAAPWTHSNPDGNGGANNYALARAHAVAATTGRPVFIVFDALGGAPIADWVAEAPADTRFQALDAKIIAALADPLLQQHGVSGIDEMIFAQGEADYLSGFGAHLDSLVTLMAKIRGRSWAAPGMPCYMMSPADVHDRYLWRAAMRHFCGRIDTDCRFVALNDLETEYSTTGQGDATHFLGTGVWRAGYDYIAQTARVESGTELFWGRGVGPASPAEPTVLATFSSLVSADSWTATAPPNGPAAAGSISWGKACFADGNYTFALGYGCVTDNLSNYGILAGRDLSSNGAADYFAGFGFQNDMAARYTLAAGRGHVLTAEGGTAIGLFSEYTGAEADAPLLQVGNGSSSSNRGNAFCVRQSGTVETKAIPVHADNAAALVAGLPVGSWYHQGDGILRVVI